MILERRHKIKTIEEIRKELGINQKEYAEIIGTNLRTYHERLKGVRLWSLEEVIKSAQLNGGEVSVMFEGRQLDITMKSRFF